MHFGDVCVANMNSRKCTFCYFPAGKLKVFLGAENVFVDARRSTNKNLEFSSGEIAKGALWRFLGREHEIAEVHLLLFSRWKT